MTWVDVLLAFLLLVVTATVVGLCRRLYVRWWIGRLAKEIVDAEFERRGWSL